MAIFPFCFIYCLCNNFQFKKFLSMDLKLFYGLSQHTKQSYLLINKTRNLTLELSPFVKFNFIPFHRAVFAIAKINILNNINQYFCFQEIWQMQILIQCRVWLCFHRWFNLLETSAKMKRTLLVFFLYVITLIEYLHWTCKSFAI